MNSDPVCISIPVHEKFECVCHQIQNSQLYLPNSIVVIHVSTYAYGLKEQLMAQYRNSDRVFINPRSYPTLWGWMFHTHVANYLYLRKRGIRYSSVILESSDSLFFRLGAAEYLRDYGACLRLIPVSRSNAPIWSAKHAFCDDPSFVRMMKRYGIKQAYFGRHEGISFARSIWEEMMKIIVDSYSFHVDEYRYPREEMYFTTVAPHLTNSIADPVTMTVESDSTWMSLLLRGDFSTLLGLPGWGTLSQQLTNRVYAVNPVARNMEDPLRLWIDSLTPQYGYIADSPPGIPFVGHGAAA